MHRMRRLLQHLPLLVLMLALASVAAACSEGARTPTEPGPLVVTQASAAGEATVDADDSGEVRGPRKNLAGDRMQLAERGMRNRDEGGPGLTFADAKGGNGKGGGGKDGGNGGGNGGGGNGGGNGGGGNGGGGNGGGKPRDLSADVQPDTWNTNWENSEGTVSIVIRGGGLDQIDPDSIALTGTSDDAEGLAPVRVQANKNQIRAFFAKGDALALLDTPERGETHELTVDFTVGPSEEGEDEETKSLTVKVRVVGPSGGGDDDGEGEEDELEAEIQPDTWNTNWAGSAGTVSVKITGDNLGDVDLDSIVLVGTDDEAEPLPALRASRSGNHIRAFFSKSDAIKTLDTPKAGERHEILIRLSAGDEETELEDTIRVVGPGN